MKKKYLLSLMLGLSSPLFAGLVDDGDQTGFPNVNVNAHLLKIARHAFPDVVNLPKGMKRAEAWRHDVAEAAQGLDIPADKLEAFLQYVLQPCTDTVVPAPHPKLKEFELYARGFSSYHGGYYSPTPPEWLTLLQLPVAERRYTTIPVLCRIAGIADGDWVGKIGEARRAGCLDTQGCERYLIEESVKTNYDFVKNDSPSERLDNYRNLVREYAINGNPYKPWRYTNGMDVWTWAKYRGDNFYSGSKMSTLFYLIFSDVGIENLRYYCDHSPEMRDFLVAIGLTNRDLFSLRKIAVEYARQSPINAPVLALRLPPEEADKLLAQYPEHAALRALLQIKQLSGQAKVDAIDEYLKNYPDYTPEDMPNTSVALNTHGELTALAGLELLKMGKVDEAMARWMQSSMPEDVGLVAEQLFSTDELLSFCRKYANQPVPKALIYSCQCAFNDKVTGQNFLTPDEIAYLLRSTLARRLMREKRYEEAKPWFQDTDSSADYIVTLFFYLKGIAEDAQQPQAERFTAEMRLGDLLRVEGNRLFGTLLEPDNVICDSSFSCQWGYDFTGVKFRKPDLPRYHYRWLAAEHYRSAAQLTPDAKQQGYALWLAGTLLKNRDRALADKDFKRLAKVAPDLIENNWFKPLSKVPAELAMLYREPMCQWEIALLEKLPLTVPELDRVELPAELKTPEQLFQFGRKIVFAENPQDYEWQQACYALFSAGRQGVADGYTLCGWIQGDNYGNYEVAATFIRKALAMNPASNLAKFSLANIYVRNNRIRTAAAIFRDIADHEEQDLELKGYAAYRYSRLAKYPENTGDIIDEKTAQEYLQKAIQLKCPQALAEEQDARQQEEK